MPINIQGRDFTAPAIEGVSQITGNLDINCRDVTGPIVQVGYTSKLDATFPPTANDDSADTSGRGVFQAGSLWLDGNNMEAYTCIDATPTAAVWLNTTFTPGDLGSLAVLNSVNNSNWSGTDLAIINGGTGASSTADARTNLGVDAAGTDNAPVASTTVAGKIEIATQGEVDAGISTTLAVTPSTLANYSGLGTGGVTVLDEDDMASNSSTAVPSQQSVKAYVDGSVVGLYDHKGSYDADTNSPNLDSSPSGVKKGDAYTVSVAGNFYAVAVEAGDVLIADQDDPTASSHWTVVNKNIPTLGTLATQNTVNNGDWSGTDLAIINGGTGASSAADARTNLGVDAAGTDNSTPVTLAGSLDYITLTGQQINRNAIDLTTDVTGALSVANGGTGSASAATARTALGVDAAGTDNSPMATTNVAGKIEIATQSEVNTGTDTSRAITPETLAAWSGRYTHPNHTGDVTSTGDGATSIAANAVVTSKINDGAVTTAKIADANVTSAKLADDAVITAKILNENVTYGKIQQVSANKILGRATAGSGVLEEITCTAAGRALLDDADAAAQRETLGLAADYTATTTDATQTELLNGASRATIADDTTWFFKIYAVARRTDADNESAAYIIEGCIDRNAGTVAFVGTVNKTILAEDTAAWDITVGADDTNKALAIKATGQASKTISWKANLTTVVITG